VIGEADVDGDEFRSFHFLALRWRSEQGQQKQKKD
jgi:hypothetical protein